MSNGINETVDHDIELPNESIKNSIEKVIQDQGLSDYDIKIVPGSKKGDNYVGIVYRINVTGKNENGEVAKLNLFAKVPPANVARRKEFKARQAFVREAFVYNEIIPTFQRFAKKKGVNEDRFESHVKCFIANTEDLEEYLVMEDLQDDGFVMFDRLSKVDFDHAKFVMEELGKFHAFSFAMKDQDMETFSKLNKLEEIFIQRPLEENMMNYVKTLLTRAKNSLEETDVECIEKFTKFEAEYFDSFFDLIDNKLSEPYAVINHGDCWNNNVLYKYENGLPVKLCLLDWQISRYASPALDLMYYIFTSTEKHLQDEHYDDLLRVYHGSLSKFLTRLGSDPEKLFPYSALQEQLILFGKFGLCMAMMILQLTLSASEDTPDLDQIAEQMQSNPDSINSFSVNFDKTEHVYNERLRGIIRDMVRLGYI